MAAPIFGGDPIAAPTPAAPSTPTPNGWSPVGPGFTGFVPGFSTDASGQLTAGPGAGTSSWMPNGWKDLVPGGHPSPFLPSPAAQSPTTSAVPAPNSTVETDPGVLSALALQQMGYAQGDAGLKSARERTIINFGDPALASEAGFGLDPQAGAFAQQNYLSGNATLARLDKQHTLARQAVINALASHGILNSGDLGYQEGQADSAYGNTVYDAKQSVLDQLAGLFSTYLDRRTALDTQVQNARLAKIQNFLSNPDAYANAFGGGSSVASTSTVPQMSGSAAVLPPATKSKAKAVALGNYLAKNA